MSALEAVAPELVAAVGGAALAYVLARDVFHLDRKIEASIAGGAASAALTTFGMAYGPEIIDFLSRLEPSLEALTMALPEIGAGVVGAGALYGAVRYGLSRRGKSLSKFGTVGTLAGGAGVALGIYEFGPAAFEVAKIVGEHTMVPLVHALAPYFPEIAAGVVGLGATAALVKSPRLRQTVAKPFIAAGKEIGGVTVDSLDYLVGGFERARKVVKDPEVRRKVWNGATFVPRKAAGELGMWADLLTPSADFVQRHPFVATNALLATGVGLSLASGASSLTELVASGAAALGVFGGIELTRRYSGKVLSGIRNLSRSALRDWNDFDSKD